MADLLENLNERQREAVLETEGYVRVIAGAGSGKTKLLVSRYAYLVQDYGIESSNILCVTFTNKAAGEMKKRIRALIGEEHDISLICTYHGFCNRLLRENPEKLFLDRQFQIIDTHQKKAILGEIYQKHELKLDYASFESILRKIGYAKRDMAYVARRCDPKPCQVLEKIEGRDDHIVEEFLQRQKATYSLDFHDLIAFAIYLLETDEEVRLKWQDRLNYIMVDEFQDSSAVEMRLVDILSGRYQNLMIVGDPDQNIYEWRGSDVKLLVDFDKEHDPTKTIILNQNYRSTPQILQCANTLIEKNALRLEKDLFTKNPAGAPVIHYHSKNDLEEMDQVIANIQKLHETEGFKYSDFAIIYRSSFLSRVAEKKLVEKNIPYEVFGGVRFYQRMEILDMLAHLKLIAFGDDVSFRRIVNKPRRKFGRVKMNHLETMRAQENHMGGNAVMPDAVASAMMAGAVADAVMSDVSADVVIPGAGMAVENSHTLFATLSRHLEDKEFEGSNVAPFVRFIEEMQGNYKEMRIHEIVNEVAKKTGYETYVRELGDEERLENLAEFKRICNEFEREFGENLSLEQFLQQIALQSNEDDDGAKDTVKLMTIHSSKGLEFPVVFILGFTEGVFPSAKSMGDRKNLGLEEERRLCYVAITRAEKHLFLMESEGESEAGMKKLVSRFLDEIGEKNYVRVGRVPEKLMRESREYTAKLNRGIQVAEMVEAAIALKNRGIGSEVEHHVFGKGIIEEVDEKRGSYLIMFEKLGQRRNISMGYFAKEHVDVRQNGKAAPGREDAGQKEAALPETIQLPKEAAVSEAVQSPEETVALREVQLPEEAAASEAVQLPKETVALREVQLPEEAAASETVQSPRESLPDEVDLDKGKVGSVQAARLQELKGNTPNLWKRDDVPHSGWKCVGVEDLGAPVGICEMCGYQIIRYAHHMEHPDYRNLSVGCVCAGKMEGDVEGAKQRENEFKNKQSRRVNFFKRKWKRSKKGNEYLKIDGHIIVLYHVSKPRESWKISIDNEFCKEGYPTREKALAAVFEVLEEESC